MSYIETPLDILLESNSYDEVIIEKSSILDLFKKNKSDSDSPKYINGISQEEFYETYLPLLIKNHNILYNKTKSIINSPKYKEVRRAFSFISMSEIKDRTSGFETELRSYMDYEGRVGIDLVDWDLYKISKNPRQTDDKQDRFWELYREISNEYTKLLTDDKLFIIDDGGDWDIGSIRITLNKPIILTPVHESHLMINPPKVKEGNPGFYLDGTYYAIRWIDKKPYRDRVETIVVKDKNKVYLRLLQDNPQFPYTIPGGGLDLDSSPIIQAENEINEEALISVKNMSATGLTFVNVYKDDSKSKFRHIKNFPIRYKGAFTELFIAEYDGKFIGNVDEKDLDYKMANEGKFVPIKDVLSLLMDKHKDALINSNLIDDETRNLLLTSYKSNNICNESTSVDLYNEKINSLYIKIPQDNDDLESNIYNHKVRFMELQKFIDESINTNINTNDLYKLFILHINKQINSVRFTYKSDHDETNKKLWLEFDKWLTELKDKVVNNIKLEQTVETTHSIEASKPKLYHISESNLDNKVLIPTKPDNYMTRNELIDNTILYVAFNQSIEKALLEMSSGNLDGKTFFVHEPINYPKSIMINPTLEQSNEFWVTNPVKVKTVGEFKINTSKIEWVNTAPIGETYLSESLSILMEADPLEEEDEPTDYTEDDEEDLIEEEPTDYTETDEEPTDDDNIEDVDIDEEPTDYTEENTDEDPLDNTTGEEDETVGGTDVEDVGTDGETPTDYTEEEGTDDTDGGEVDDTTAEDEPTEDETETNNGSVVKNKFLLKDFSRLYEMVDDLIDNLETTVYINPIQNSGLSQVIKNMKKIKDFVVDYIENHFKVDDYTSNLYYYNIAIQSLKINYKMLEKIQELDGNNKQIDKNKS